MYRYKDNCAPSVFVAMLTNLLVHVRSSVDKAGSVPKCYVAGLLPPNFDIVAKRVQAR